NGVHFHQTQARNTKNESNDHGLNPLNGVHFHQTWLLLLQKLTGTGVNPLNVSIPSTAFTSIRREKFTGRIAAERASQSPQRGSLPSDVLGGPEGPPK